VFKKFWSGLQKNGSLEILSGNWRFQILAKLFGLRGVPKGRVTVAQYGFGAARILVAPLRSCAESVLGRRDDKSKSRQGRLTVCFLYYKDLFENE
jgi:hypothetical protein